MFKSLLLYQDRYKCWLKRQLQNVCYLENLSFETLEQLSYIGKLNFYEQGQYLFKSGTPLKQIFILAEGQIEVFNTLVDEDIVFDILHTQGCVLGPQTALDSKENISYSARTKIESTILVI